MLTGPPGQFILHYSRPWYLQVLGTGKSFLLSLFFDLLPTKHKRRWHYHAFTLYLYRRVFAELQRAKSGEDRSVENMEKAASRGWRSVFAGGRWNDEAEETNSGNEETIPFISM